MKRWGFLGLALLAITGHAQTVEQERTPFTDSQIFMDECGALPTAPAPETEEEKAIAAIAEHMCAGFVRGIMETVAIADQPYTYAKGDAKICLPPQLTILDVLKKVSEKKRWKPLLRTTPPTLLVVSSLKELSTCSE